MYIYIYICIIGYVYSWLDLVYGYLCPFPLGGLHRVWLHLRFLCALLLYVFISEFRDVVFEDVVFDNNRISLILYLDFT